MNNFDVILNWVSFDWTGGWRLRSRGTKNNPCESDLMSGCSEERESIPAGRCQD